jgi:hypothetical protein
MYRWICRIRELLRHEETLGVRLKDTFGFRDCARHALWSFGQHQFCAKRCEDLPPLDAHCLWHRQHDSVAARSSDESQSDAGIATGWLDNYSAGLKQTSFLGIPDHRCADSAFDRVGRIAAFDFGQHRGIRAVGDAIQFNQRRVPDGE